jgi:AmpD protein
VRVNLDTHRFHEENAVKVYQWIPSPNCSDRPSDTVIDLLVIHGISLPPGEWGADAITALFTNTLDPNAHPYFAQICHLRVSAHVLIQRNGALIQYVPFDKQAWHAGVSSFQNREVCNTFSIGVELEGTDDKPYEPAQYQQLTALTKALMIAYPGITPSRIVGHSDIAPGRKTDPGPFFDWKGYLGGL